MLLEIVLSTLLLASVGNSFSCDVKNVCREFQMYATRYQTPFQAADARISFNGDLTGAASLNGRPLEMELPTALNVTEGNSGRATAFIALILADDSSLRCTYRGVGIGGNAYAFQSCSVGDYQPGAVLSAKNVTVSVDNGGNTLPGQRTTVLVILRESRNCLSVPALRYDEISEDLQTGRLVYGVYPGLSTTISCFTSVTPYVSTMESTMDLPSTTNSMTSSPTTTGAVDTPSATSALPWNLIYIIAGAAGGGLLIVTMAVCLICRKRRKRYDEEKPQVFGSRDTVMYTKYAWEAERSAYGEPAFEEQLQFSSASITSPQKSNEASSDAPHGAECTLMNTKAAIALPGFLQLDYQVDFRPEKVIAEGGGGTIYIAELLDDRLKAKHRIRKVAVKVVKNAGNWTHEEMLNCFKQEVSIMWSLSHHENIIKLVGYTDEPMSIVMKYYSQSLSDLVRLAKEHDFLSDEIVLRFTYHIVHAMNEIHSLGIVHRDLKTSNLLIDAPVGSEPQAWKVVVCDFGLAKVLGQTAVKAAIKVDIQGISIRYAAPEVFARIYLQNAKSRRFDETVEGEGDVNSSKDEMTQIETVQENEEEMKGDIYAFAIILWEMLAKEMSWSGLTNDEIEWRVKQEERPPINETITARLTSNEIMTMLVDIMEAAWSQDPQSRPSFSAIKNSLKPYYEFLPQRNTSTRFSHRFSQIDMRDTILRQSVMGSSGNNTKSGIGMGIGIRDRSTSNRHLGPMPETADRRRVKTMSGALFSNGNK